MSTQAQQSHSCPNQNHCGGCQLLGQSQSEQHAVYRHALKQAWTTASLPQLPSKIKIHGDFVQDGRSLAEFSYRRYEDRCAVGWFHTDHTELQSILDCPALTPKLQSLYRYIANTPPPIEHCTFRIRVSPDGQLGCWIDTANTAIATLLSEKLWLKALMEKALVEIGQKHKRVTEINGALKLQKPILESWFQSYRADGTAIPLWSTIATFSQPSLRLNQTLVERVIQHITATKARSWLEFGSGSGNFTLPIAALGLKVTATESSSLGRKGLALGLKPLENGEHVRISPLNLQRNTAESRSLISETQALLLDPPRSGIGSMQSTLQNSSSKPKFIVYLACALKGLITDSQSLFDMGYRLKHIEGIAQFPNTTHCEWIACFEL